MRGAYQGPKSRAKRMALLFTNPKFLWFLSISHCTLQNFLPLPFSVLYKEVNTRKERTNQPNHKHEHTHTHIMSHVWPGGEDVERKENNVSISNSIGDGGCSTYFTPRTLKHETTRSKPSHVHNDEKSYVRGCQVDYQ